jgi:acylglycerol lipase
MVELEKRAEEINVRECGLEINLTVAIRLIHGSSDRATSHHGTLRLFDRLPNDDKEIEIYEGYEHGE